MFFVKKIGLLEDPIDPEIDANYIRTDLDI